LPQCSLTQCGTVLSTQNWAAIETQSGANVMSWRQLVVAAAITAISVAAAWPTPPLPVGPAPTGVCARLERENIPPRTGLEFHGAVGDTALWATPKRFACNEPAFGGVDCFAGSGLALLRIETRGEVTGYALAARESIRITPRGVACTAPSDGPSEAISDEPALDMNIVHAAIAAEAQRLYGGECGQVFVPERAIVAVELTGDGHPEYAVLFSRVQCRADGGATTRWQGTGGAVVQFWLASGGPPRMLLEHSMLGFSPADEFSGLITHQHGAFCPGGAGPNVCEVNYRWNDRDRALEAASRTLVDDSAEIDRRAQALRFGYDTLTQR
jgi:hypothetical protein